MKAAAGTLAAVPMARRVGATVLHDGRRWAVWSYGTVTVPVSPGSAMTTIRPVCRLWSDEHGEVELIDVDERKSRSLPVVDLHLIHRPGVAACTKRNEHTWPDALVPDAECQRCALPYREFTS